MKCPFCELQVIKKREIFRNDLVRVFPTNTPIVPGHLLILPVRHVATCEELTADELDAIFAAMAKVKPVLKKLYKAEGFNYAWNEGKSAGQEVPHFHLHMLPRTKGDTGITNYDPRKYLYRTGTRETKSELELQKIAKQIRDNI